MTKVTIDAASAKFLSSIQGEVELCDESGKVLGRYHPGLMIPPRDALHELDDLSEEELNRRSQNRQNGRSLEQIMRFAVLWSSDAERDLANLWMDSSNRSAITSASDQLERALAEDADSLGESRTGERRIATSKLIS